MYSFCNDNIRIVADGKGNIGITVNGMEGKPLLVFDKKISWMEELSSRGNDKSIVRLGVFSKNEEEDTYLIEEVLVDIIKCKYLRSLIGITKERSERVNGEIYKYYDVDGRLCLLDFKTNILRVGEEASKRLAAYRAIGEYFGKNTFWEELPKQENINSEDLKRLYKSHYQDVPMKDFITIAAIVNLDSISSKNVLLKIKVNLNLNPDCRERKYEIVKNPFVYEDAEWLCDYMYQAVESSKEGRRICLVNVRDEENKVSRIEQNIRNSLRNKGEIVTGFEIKPFECGNSVNPLMRELVISFSNFERLHFILKLDRDNPDGYMVYNMVYSCSFNHYHSIINQHRATNVFLNKESFLFALSKLPLGRDGRKTTQIDRENVKAKLEKTVKRLSRIRRKLLTD